MWPRMEAAPNLQPKKSMPSYGQQTTADIIAVAGNPLDDASLLGEVNFVMKGGKIYKSKLSGN